MLLLKENKDSKGEAKIKYLCLTKTVATALQTIHLTYNLPFNRLTGTPVLIPISTITIGEEIDLNAERLLLAYQIVNIASKTGENDEERVEWMFRQTLTNTQLK